MVGKKEVIKDKIYEKARKLLEEAEKETGRARIRVWCIFGNGTKKKRTLFIATDGDIGYVAKGYRNAGYSLNKLIRNGLIDIEKPQQRKSFEQKWRDAWIEVLNRLERSGLWEEEQKDIKLALEIGVEKLQKAYEVYWDTLEKGEKRIQMIKEIDERLIAKTEDGTEGIRRYLIWTYYEIPKVKEMRFSFNKDENRHKLQLIAEAMQAKKPIDVYGRTNYDVRFSYNPEQNKAWYAEEFKGMGNGYYYIALDETHALFVEKD